jgi:transposase
MLADQLDFVVGVDSHRDTHAVAVVAVVTGVVVFEASVAADSDGYVETLRLASEHAPGRRAFAIEGTASYGAGLTRYLLERDEQVFEVGRPRRERRSGGKTDALDAIRAARSVLTQKRGAMPGSAGEREALRALMTAREGAAVAKQAGLNQLYALLVTTPEPLRAELRGLTRARLLNRLAATRPTTRHDPEIRGTLIALRAIARRVRQLTTEERELAREIDRLVRKLAPQLLDQPGVGTLLAAHVLLAWSHRGRLPNEAAFARLAGVAPIPASSGQNDPLPPRPQRRPKAQPDAPPHPAHQETITRPHDQLHRATTPRRQDPARSNSLPQALPRPQPLPPTRKPATHERLTNIEASLAQAVEGLTGASRRDMPRALRA